MAAGKLIAIEGIDGAGTTTQAELLAHWMNGDGTVDHGGARAHLTREPSDGPLGRLLRRLLKRELPAIDPAAMALLFAGDRVDHVCSEIAPRLQEGLHVVTDRYVFSSLAYQSLELELSWVAEINRLAPEPDLTCYLRVTPDLAGRRREARGDHEEIFDPPVLQARIASKYDGFFGSSPESGSWRLDPSGSVSGSVSGSGWIRVDPGPDPGRDPGGLGATGRRPCWAVLDGSLPIDALQRQLRKLTKKICPDLEFLPI